MSQFRSKILIIALLCISIVASLLTVLILYATGNLVYERVELVFTVINGEKTYDGTPLLANNFILESGELMKGHSAEAELTGSQTDVGVSESGLKLTVKDEDGFDVTHKYEVKVHAGTLTVTPQVLSVELADGQAVYNGREVEFANFEIVAGKLAEGHYLAASHPNAKLMNVGDSLPDDLKPIVYDGLGKVVTDNYLVMFSVGNVRIVPREITIKPETVAKVYDGGYVTVDKTELVSGSLAAGQSVQAKILTEDGYAATAKDANGDGVRTVIDEDNLKIFADDGITEVTENYDITYESSLLKIEKRALTLASPTQNWDYDGEEHSADTISIISGSLAAGQDITVTHAPKVINVTEEDNDITFSITADGFPVTENYEITFKCGKLKINKKPITLYAKTVTKVFDGAPLSELFQQIIMAGENIFEASAELGDKFRITAAPDDVVARKTDVESGTYSLSVNITLGGKTCNENFEIKVISGQFSITKKPVSVTLNNLSMGEYSAQNSVPSVTDAFDGAELAKYDLSADNFTIQTYGETKNAGMYYYTAVFNGDSRNYDIVVMQGTFTIERRKARLIFVKSVVEMTYNGKFYDVNLNDLSIDGIMGCKITDATFNKVLDLNVSDKGYKTAKGTQTINATSVKVSLRGEDITNNLDLDLAETMQVKLKPRILNITYSAFFCTDIDNLSSLDLVGSINVTPVGEDECFDLYANFDADEKKYWLVDCVITNSDGIDVTNLYDFGDLSYGYGVITVTP